MKCYFLSLPSIRSSDTFLNGNESAEENDQAVNYNWKHIAPTGNGPSLALYLTLIWMVFTGCYWPRYCWWYSSWSL